MLIQVPKDVLIWVLEILVENPTSILPKILATIKNMTICWQEEWLCSTQQCVHNVQLVFIHDHRETV